MSCQECAMTQLMQPCEACSNYYKPQSVVVLDNDFYREEVARRKTLQYTTKRKQ